MVLIAGILAIAIFLAVELLYIFSKLFILIGFLLFCYWYFKKSASERLTLWNKLVNIYYTVKALIFRR